jgi:hypothetical protein
VIRLVKPGRIPEKERNRAMSGIIHALENNPEGLGVRDLRKASGIKSNETFYKYLPTLSKKGIVEFSEVNVGRGKPKKVFKLTKKGVAASIEFRLMEYFEKIRESCKESEQFEIDNFTYAYAIYGMPKNLTNSEKKQTDIILKRINSALIDLDELRDQVNNKEAYIYRKAITSIYAKILQHVAGQNKDRKPMIIDLSLQNELHGYIPSHIKEKMKLHADSRFALVATRGPSFIDEYSLRPENQLLELVQSTERWDSEGIASIIGQLAKNKNFDQKAIERMKKWDNPNGRISNFYWQQIREQLGDIPRIREDQRKAKEEFTQSGRFKYLVGLRDETSLVITKEMLGKEKLEELQKEFESLSLHQQSTDRS